MCLLMAFCFSHAVGQDLGNISRQKPLRLTGTLSVQSQVYRVSGIDPRQQPFYWSLSGSPVLHLYGIQIPFFILQSNQQRQFQQPFNQIGISPYYKWAKFYAGYNQVRFSPFTLAGRRFLGVGTELNPGVFRLGFVYGRFQRAIGESLPTQQPGQAFLSSIPIPSYDRKGIAVKLGIGKTKNYLDLSLLYAKDDQESIEIDSVKPEQNLALGLGFQISFTSWLKWKMDAGISAFTRDQVSDTFPIPDLPVIRTIEKYFPAQYTTQIRTAVESSISLERKAFGLKLGYKHIDKDYKSMGAYYFLTDVEELTLSPNLNLLKNRLRIFGSIGFQRDNLNQTKAHTTRRLIGSGQLAYMPNARFGLNVQYANYGLSQNPIQRGITDTTLLEQVNQNLSIMPRLSFANENRIQNLVLVIGYHALSDQSRGITYNSEMRSAFANFNYHLNLLKSGWGFQGSLNSQRVFLSQGNTESLGAGLGASKSAIKSKLSFNLHYAFFHNRFNQQANGFTHTLRLGGFWQMKANHRMNLQIRHLIHYAPLGGPNPSFNESQGKISYQFQFN